MSTLSGTSPLAHEAFLWGGSLKEGSVSGLPIMRILVLWGLYGGPLPISQKVYTSDQQGCHTTTLGPNTHYVAKWTVLVFRQP